MAGGGEEKAVFVGLKNDAEQSLPQAAHHVARFAEDTSRKVDQGVAAHMEGDAQLGSDFTHLAEHPPEGAPVHSPASPGGAPAGGKPPETVPKVSVPSTESESLAAKSDQQVAEGAHVDGEGGSTDDPIDVVTGEMFLPLRDLLLPGVLPLAFTRRHGSNYRHGRWFGVTWASTLDQRVEIDEDGIHLALEDGRVLHYPVPTVHGQQVMPSQGPRWPLSWNRTEDVITVGQVERGRTLHFPPGPTPEICRPLSAITDRGGDRITFVYDSDGVPTDVYHSGGYHLRFDSTESRGGVRISALKLDDPHGGQAIPVQEYRYDAAGRLTGVLDSTRLALGFEYDAAERITQWTDRNGYSYRYHYRKDGRVERAEGSGGFLSVSLDYDLAARTTTVTDALGHATVYHWNKQLKTVKVIDPLGHEILTEHDRHGHVIETTDALGHVTRFDRDGFGDVLRVQRADGTSIATSYNEHRQPVTVTGPDGARWSYEYDETGPLRAVTGPCGEHAEYRHDPAESVHTYRDPLGRETRTVHDKAGLPIEMTRPDGAVIRLRRDAFGRVVEITDPVGARTTLSWSTEGRPLERRLPDGSAETWRYDPEGNLIEHMNPAGSVTRFEYGPFDMLTARIEPDGARYSFDYDLTLNATAVTAPTGRVWTYAYDPCRNLVSETDFNGATTTYTPDAAGRLIERVNAVGQTTTVGYDPLGRITRRQAGDKAYSYQYDPSGRLVRAEGPDTIVDYGHDAAGRVLAETVNGRQLAHVYDAAGQRTERTTPAGVVSRWTYDAAGRPTALAGAAGSLTFAYDAAGRETTRNLGPAAALTTSYDELGRLTGQGVWRLDQPELQAAPDSPGRWRALQTRTYTYRADGTPTGIDDQLRGPRTFDLDPTGRVTAVQGANRREQYAYDGLGNLTAATVPNGQPDSDGDREITGTLVHRAGRTSSEHDAAGRLIRRIRITLSGRLKQWTYTWDPDNRLTHATTPDGRRFDYSYDPLGRRIAKTEHAPGGEATRITHFTWDGPRLIEEISAEGPRVAATTWDHDPGTFTPAAQTRRTWVDGATTEQIDQAFHAIITDLVGTPTELVAPDGQIAWRTQASLWGHTTTVAGSTADCPLRFPGQYHDDETGLDYSYQRYYSPEDAAFLTPDPLGLAPAPNNHAYVPNPHTSSDPLGLAPDYGSSEDPEPIPQTLYHYTNAAGQQGILSSQELRPSLKAANPKDARYGDGQYLTDIAPGTKTQGQLSAAFLRVPWAGQKFTHYIEIDTTGLNVVKGRENVFVVPNDGPLDLTGRIVSSGMN